MWEEVWMKVSPGVVSDIHTCGILYQWSIHPSDTNLCV